MESFESIKKSIKGAQSLDSIARTMKILAAVSLRQYEKSIRSITEYNEIIEMGLTILFHTTKSPDELIKKIGTNGTQKTGVVVFGSDMGMCGRFNEQIIEFMSDNIRDLKRDDITMAVIGEKGATRLENAGFKLSQVLDYPAGLSSGMTPLLGAITNILEHWYFKESISKIILYYNSPLNSGLSYTSKQTQILPLSNSYLETLNKKKWKSSSIPVIKENRQNILDRLVMNSIYVNLRMALSASVTSENGARLLAMQAAEKNIDEHLEDLNLQFNQERQNLITSEILDIIAGFETVIE
jgi:F-type H+-transporting ATPase subunit gamma